MNLAQHLVNTARSMPNKAAVRCEGRHITFRALDIQSNRLANAFRDLGLEPGDPALIMMPNSIDRFVVYYALAKAGLVEIPVHCESSEHQLGPVVEETNPKIFIGAEPYLDEARKVFSRVRGPSLRLACDVPRESEFINLDATYSNRPEFPLHAADADDRVAVLYGGGLKGASLSQGDVARVIAGLTEMQGVVEPETVVIGMLSLHHVCGISTVMNGSVNRALTVELYRRFNPEEIVALMERERHTMLYAVPDMLLRLMETVQDQPLKRKSLRFCLSGSGSLPPEEARRFEMLFGTGIHECPGMAGLPMGSDPAFSSRQ